MQTSSDRHPLCHAVKYFFVLHWSIFAWMCSHFVFWTLLKSDRFPTSECYSGSLFQVLLISLHLWIIQIITSVTLLFTQWMVTGGFNLLFTIWSCLNVLNQRNMSPHWHLVVLSGTPKSTNTFLKAWMIYLVLKREEQMKSWKVKQKRKRSRCLWDYLLVFNLQELMFDFKYVFWSNS